MYGFEPTLVAGGKPTLDNLCKLKLDPHLLILRSFDTPKLPGTDTDQLRKRYRFRLPARQTRIRV